MRNNTRKNCPLKIGCKFSESSTNLFIKFKKYRIQKEQAALYGDRKARDFARQNAKIRQQENEKRKNKRAEEINNITESPPSPVQDAKKSDEHQEVKIASPDKPSEHTATKPDDSVFDEQPKEPTPVDIPVSPAEENTIELEVEEILPDDTVATIHELTVGTVTEVKGSGERVTMQAPSKPDDEAEHEVQNVPEEKSNFQDTKNYSGEGQNSDEISNEKDKSTKEEIHGAPDGDTQESSEQVEEPPKPPETNESVIISEPTEIRSKSQITEELPSQKTLEKATEVIEDKNNEIEKRIVPPGDEYFIESEDEFSHSSLDSDIEDAELLKLIDNLDSD